MEAPALLKFTIVSQPGLPRRQIYYPYMSFRLSRPLQVITSSYGAWYWYGTLSDADRQLMGRAVAANQHAVFSAGVSVRDVAVAGVRGVQADGRRPPCGRRR